MGLETARTIAELDENNPLGSDQVKFGDDHIRMVKNVLKDDLSWLWMQNRIYSFQAGAVVTSADILYDEASLKFYHWEGVYVSGNYTVPAGSTPATAGGIGAGKWVDVGQGTLREFLASDQGASIIGGLPPIQDLSNLQEKQKADFQARANMSLFSLRGDRCNVLLIGDSITAGVGTAAPDYAYAALLGQSVANFYADGYSYPLHRNTNNGYSLFTHNGSNSNNGLTGDSITLTAGQLIGFSKTEAVAFAGYIIGGVSTVGATLQLLVNGVVQASTTVTAAAQQDFFMTLSGAQWVSSADTVQLRANGGTVVVSGVAPLKEGQGHKLIVANNTSPLFMTAGASGQSFDYFVTNASLVAAMLNSFSATGKPAVVIIALGTNSIYNSGQAQTPAEYVASLQSLMTAISGLRGNTSYVLTIPPQANEGLWPVIKPNTEYQDYVDAIKNMFGGAYDLIDLNVPSLNYSDGVHPSAIGHEALAKHWCEFLGIPFNPNLPSIDLGGIVNGASPIIITGGYAIKDAHGIVHLAGSLVPNGAGTNLLTTLNGAFRPKKDRKIIVPLFNGSTYGTGVIQIATNGEMRLVYNSMIWTELNLDGMSYVI